MHPTFPSGQAYHCCVVHLHVMVHRAIGNFVQSILGVHDMQQASRKAEPGDYKHAVNDM